MEVRQYLLTESRLGSEFPGSQGKEGNLGVPLLSLPQKVNLFITKVLLVLYFINNFSTNSAKNAGGSLWWTFIYLEKTTWGCNGTGVPVTRVLVQSPALLRQFLSGSEGPVKTSVNSTH